MNTLQRLSAIALLAVTFAAAPRLPAAEVKSYQVTGIVQEVTDKMIVVKKDDEVWQVARAKSTKMDHVPKVGDRVTIYYRMVAEEVEVKSDAKKK